MSELFRCKNGETVRIAIDELGDFEAKVIGPSAEEIGRFEFLADWDFGYLKLMWMYLDLKDPRWKHQGIGREILLRVKNISGLPIVTSDNDGLVREDGSHLTGDAPAFVAKMRKEGIITEQPV